MVTSIQSPRQDEIIALVNQYNNDRAIQNYNEKIAELIMNNSRPYAILANGIIIDWGRRWTSEKAKREYDILIQSLNNYKDLHYGLILKNHGK